MKRIKNNKLLVGLMVGLLIILVIELTMKTSNKIENAVYAKNSDVIYQGSLLYNFAQCAGCHGIAYDGKGPDASNLKSQGIAVPGFTTDQATATTIDKTYLEYFETISLGSELMPDHIFLNFTDRGRWSMAHFLYSLREISAGPKERKELRKRLKKIDKKIAKLYQKNPRFAELDYKQSENIIRDTSKIPKLEKAP